MLDVGETLFDGTRAWTRAAQAAGVTPLTLFAALGALIDRGADHRAVWELLGIPPARGPTPTPSGVTFWVKNVTGLASVRLVGAERFDVLAGDLGDQLEVTVVMQDSQTSEFGQRGDQ